MYFAFFFSKKIISRIVILTDIVKLLLIHLGTHANLSYTLIHLNIRTLGTQFDTHVLVNIFSCILIHTFKYTHNFQKQN